MTVLMGPAAGRHAAPGRHSVGFYGSDLAFLDEVLPFVSRALAEGAAILVVATPEHRALVDAGLLDSGVDVAGHRAAGRYVTLDAAETLAGFLVDGAPDPAGFRRVVGAVVTDLAERHGDLRIFGEMVGLLWDVGDVPGAMALEGQWNELQSEVPFTLHCGYGLGDAAATDLAAVHQICGTHSSVTTSSWRTPGRGERRASTFLPTAAAPGQVRRFLQPVLADWRCPPTMVDEAELVASELATNAVVHARAPFTVTVARIDGQIQLEFRDPAPAPPIARTAPTSSTSGRGLAIVRSVALAFGVEHQPGGKTVWVRLGA